MSNEVMFAVLLSAALNAGWNSAIKIGGDRVTVMALTTLVGSAMSLVALPFVTLPAAQSWWLLALSIAIHTVYHFVLPMAYARGDLGLVFPIARGSAPLLVMVGGAAFAGESPGMGALLGVACLSGGILSLALGAQRGGRHPAIGYALLTGLLIASYTVVDALGARQGGSAWGFAVLVTLGDGIATALGVLLWKGRRVMAMDARTLRLCTTAGAMQMGAYWIAVWALARAPMASVSALRETSVLFVALISAFVLKEGLGRRRLAAAALVCAGIAMVWLA